MNKLWFLIRTAVKNCYYHRSLGVLIVFAGIVLLTVNLVLLTVRVNTDVFFERLQDKARVEIFLQKTISSDDVTALYERIEKETRVTVRSVVYHDPEHNLKEFFEKNPEIQKIATLLEGNPLPGTMTVHVMIDRHTRNGIISFIQDLRANEGVTEVIYPEAWFTRLSDLLEWIDYILLALVAAVSLVSYTMWYSLFHVALYRVKTEIEIMEVVGGTKLYIRTPFMLESTVYALFSFIGAFGVVSYGMKKIAHVLPGMVAISRETLGIALGMVILLTLFATERAINGFFKR